jgi:hypothetical protein
LTPESRNRPRLLRTSTTQWPANASMLRKPSRTSCLAKKNTAYLNQVGPWWSMAHHLMQALTVLLLELSQSTTDEPKDQEILPKVKELIRWLRVLKMKDRVAGRAHESAFGILQRIGSRKNVDISDLLQENVSPVAIPFLQSSSRRGVHDQFQQPFTGEHNYDSGTSHQFMFAYPSHTYQGGSQVPQVSGFAINLPLGSQIPGTSSATCSALSTTS